MALTNRCRCDVRNLGSLGAEDGCREEESDFKGAVSILNLVRRIPDEDLVPFGLRPGDANFI